MGQGNLAGNRPGGGAIANGPSSGLGQGAQRPTQGQLNSFLGMPQNAGGGLAGQNRPSQLPSDSGPKSITTPGGSTITVGGGGGSYTGPRGNTVGGAAGGIQIEGAGGNTFTKVGGVGGVTNGSNSAIAGGSASAIQGAGGNSAARVRGGAATSGGARAAGSVGGVQTRNGYTAVGARGAVSAGGVTRAGAVAGIRGPYGGTVAAGRGAAFVNGQFVGGAASGAVNGNFRGWGAFTGGWWGRYPGTWWPGKWAVGATAWAIASWATAGSYCGCTGEPCYYDYGGDAIAYEDGTVYYGDQPVATEEQYYDQASQIADAGQNTTNGDWLPLGVFGIIAEGQTTTDKLVQLALNKDGTIRGNYQDMISDKVTPIVGSVDKATQRVALRIEGNKLLVAETGLYNLTNDEVPILIHFGKDRHETRTLIRLQENAAQGEAPAQSAIPAPPAPAPTTTP